MAQVKRVQEDVDRLRGLANQHRGAIEPIVATMGTGIWLGPAADTFGSEVAGRQTRVRSALDNIVRDAEAQLRAAEAQLRATPPDPTPAPVRSPFMSH